MPLPTSGYGFPGGTIIVSGFTASTAIDSAELNVRNLIIKRGFEGPQLILKWDFPITSFDEIILVRKRYDFPRTPTDGLVLQSGTFTEFVDTDLVHAEYFYYSLFVKRGGEFTLDAIASRIKGISFRTGENVEHLLGCLASIHKVSDNITLPLPPATNPADKVFQSSLIPSGEKFHLDEPQNQEFGQLARMLRIFGIQLDSYQGELDYLEEHIADPKNASSCFLEALSGVVGWEFNAELPISQQRKEIEGAVALYKIKGTLASVKQLAEAILEIPVVVVEKHRNVLISNKFRRRSLNRSLQTMLNLGTCDDLVAYSWTSDRLANERLDRVLVCADLPKDTPLTPSQVIKMARILGDFLPATIIGGVQINDEICLESKDISAETFDDFFDFIDADFMDEPALGAQSVLRSNFATRTSNSIPLGRSVANSGVGEEWYDEITYT